MSEQQNVTVIQQMFEAFARGDVQTILDNCTADCEFYCPGPAIVPYTGRKNGRAEIQTYFETLIGSQSNPNLRIDRFVAQGDTVVAIGNYTAVVNATGKTIESPVVLTFDLQDGAVRRHMVLGDTAAIAMGYTGTAAAAS
jgi:ketosteroid isomerase-like protein